MLIKINNKKSDVDGLSIALMKKEVRSLSVTEANEGDIENIKKIIFHGKVESNKVKILKFEGQFTDEAEKAISNILHMCSDSANIFHYHNQFQKNSGSHFLEDAVKHSNQLAEVKISHGDREYLTSGIAGAIVNSSNLSIVSLGGLKLSNAALSISVGKDLMEKLKRNSEDIKAFVAFLQGSTRLTDKDIERFSQKYESIKLVLEKENKGGMKDLTDVLKKRFLSASAKSTLEKTLSSDGISISK